MLNTLVTSEVKNAAGTEVEFDFFNQNGSAVILKKKTESPAYKHRLSLSHKETGSGISARRRSVLRIDIEAAGSVDTATPVKGSAYIVLDNPIGNISDTSVAKDCLAELGSFAFTLATNTYLYDGTGNGSVLLLGGGL
jgi:hypothetical protein